MYTSTPLPDTLEIGGKYIPLSAIRFAEWVELPGKPPEFRVTLDVQHPATGPGGQPLGFSLSWTVVTVGEDAVALRAAYMAAITPVSARLALDIVRAACTHDYVEYHFERKDEARGKFVADSVWRCRLCFLEPPVTPASGSSGAVVRFPG